MQLAQHAGAEVFATAHPDKWETLRGLGLDDDHIASSRDAGFADAFLAVSGGQGVDVVLNSLAQELVDASLGLLRRGGRFVEMGKTDIRDPEQVAASHPGVSYRAFDTSEAGAERIAAMLAEIVALFERGALRHAPISARDVRQGVEAFRLMSQGGHVGKIVLTIPAAPDPGSTALITGGTGTIGSHIARHLVERRGVRHLILASRSGLEADGAGELKAELEGLGAEVQVVACDVAEPDQLAELLAKVPEGQPLRTVIHAAGALDDGVVESLTPDRLDAVFRPKVDAAWSLHELTKDLDLAEFILFSSLAATLGSPGQGNYAAANGFLDGLAARRCAEGLPALALAWGLWEETSGMTAHLDEEEIARASRGPVAMSTDQGLSLFERARASEAVHLVATPVDRGELRRQARAGSLPAILSGLVETGARATAGRGSLARRLATAAEQERGALVLELVRSEAATVLGHAAAAEIDPERAFKEQGFDSLAAVELRNRLGTALGLRLPATLAFDRPSAVAMTAYLCEQIEGGGQSAAVRPRPSAAAEEPLAIVGMSCRLPGGVRSPDTFWQLVAAGADGIVGFPTNRDWDLDRVYDPDPDRIGTSYAREGGFIADADEFDAEFFGIAPREALAMDPQQRLLLELAWEALEDAGIDPASLRGGQAGVFVGISSSDYDTGVPAAAELEGYVGTGNLTSVVSGRLAYSFGLEGPAITVDTACSSSLVAMHLACQALRSGECDLALAGGATVMSTPQNFIEFSRQRGLAPDGRCKSFAAAADGTGCAEGAGLLVLERLSEAQRNGHRVWATIRGSAVNQDGASNGLTAPNGPSQERVIRQALANAGLKPADVDAVEAHGTGTALGDPIEAGALIAAYGQDREQPLWLGSVKSNIGHTQAAAGVAGVIKMVMAMREGVLPQTLHVDQPSAKVDWEAGAVELLAEPQPWQPNGRPRRAGVSSFGISGTNAHLILEETPGDGEGDGAGEGDGVPGLDPIPWVVTAKSTEALRAQAERLVSHLNRNPQLDPRDVGFSLATSRAQLEHRAVLLGAGREQLLAAASALASGGSSGDLIRGAVQPGRAVFLFTGQGAQRAGMGRELHGAFPSFAVALDEACAELDPHLDRSLRDLLFASPDSAEAELLDRTELTQPAMFAIEVALFRLVESLGLKPDFLSGHSVGEIAAAHVGGVLSLADACALVAARGRLMGALPEGGAMVAVEASEEELLDSLGELSADLSLAGVNGPSSVVVSGEEEAASELARRWREQGRKATRLQVSHAFHSHRIDPMLEQLLAVAEGLSFSRPQIPIVSNLSGELLSEEQATSPAYWARQAREPVRFLDGVRFLAAQGTAHFVELGPDGVLSAMARECLAAGGGTPAVAVPLLRRDRPEVGTALAALAAAHANGLEVEWGALFAGRGGKVSLPTYPFQRKRYWARSKGRPGDVSAAGLVSSAHPLLGATLSLANEAGQVFTGRLSREAQPWLAEHAIFGTAIVPGTAFVELALSVGAELGAGTIEELTQEAPLVLAGSEALQIQLGLGESDEGGRRSLSLHSRGEGAGQDWVRNASAVLTAEPPPRPAADLREWPPVGAEPLAVEQLYEDLAGRGFDYGPIFRGLRAAWRRGEELFAEVELGERGEDGTGGFAVHPALLDAALHADFLASAAEEVRLPFSWSGVALHAAASGDRLRARLAPVDGGFSLLAADEDGAPLVSVAKLATRPVSESQLRAAGVRHDSLFRLAWKEIPTPASSGSPMQTELHRVESEPGGDAARASLDAAARVLEIVQDWLAGEHPEPARLALLTGSALATDDDESPDLAGAAVWGLLRSAQSEHPGRFVLIDSDGTPASEAAIPMALASGESQLAIRRGRLLVGRLERVQGDGGEGAAAPIDPEATVLISGGTGALGALFARHLVEQHGARQLLLLSRRGPEAEGCGELVAQLEAAGASVRVVACDVGDREALALAVGQIPAEHPLGTAIHAAGILDDGVIGSLTEEQLAKVFAAKVGGAWNLHQLTREADRSVELILFSSLAATIGSPGQASYAAANSFLDALACRRRAQGLPALSLGWGAWEQDGIAAGLGGVDRARIARSGVAGLSSAEGRQLFDLARRIGGSLQPLRLNITALRAAAAAAALPAPMLELVPVAARGAAASESLARRLARADPSEHEEVTLELVREECAAVLGHPSPEAIAPERSFQEAGFDSLCAVELRNRLNQVTGMRLPSTVVFDHPSPQALAEFVLAAAGEESAGQSRLDADLDRVEAAMASAAAGEREQALERLRALLSAAAEGGENGAADGDLESVSDEEMIALIDREFGA